MQSAFNPTVMGFPRPNSVALSQPSSLHEPSIQQRTMSMVDPMLGSFNPQHRGPGYAPSIAPTMGVNASVMGGTQPGYTPSIAPSERNTIGLPSRYRPVTQVQLGNGSRSSTMTSGVGLNWQQQKTAGASGLRATVAKDDDDDDDSAWEEMKRQKDAKKDGWKKRKDLTSMLPFGSGTSSAATVTSS